MRQEVKLLKDGPRSAIAVAYQTISTSFASRPFDKPHNGRSVCRSRLRVAHDAKGSLDNKPAHHKILRQQWRGHGQRLRPVQVRPRCQQPSDSKVHREQSDKDQPLPQPDKLRSLRSVIQSPHPYSPLSSHVVRGSLHCDRHDYPRIQHDSAQPISHNNRDLD